MDLIRGMRAFVAVVDAGSFTDAAERLDVSNKAVSRQVAELERRLGARLLNRTTRTSSLTEAGDRYYRGCVQLLDSLDALENGLREDERGLRGTLRIAAPVTFGEMRVVPHLAEFAAAHPDLVVDLRLNDRHVDLVDEGFDVAVRIGKLADSGLVARRLGSTGVWTVASPAYLAGAGTPKTPDQLKEHRCLRDSNFRSGSAWPYTVDGARRLIGIRGGLLVNSARSVRDLARDDRGVGLCPSYVVEDDVREKRLRRILRPFEGPTLDIYAVYSSATNLAPKVRSFVTFLTDVSTGTG